VGKWNFGYIWLIMWKQKQFTLPEQSHVTAYSTFLAASHSTYLPADIQLPTGCVLLTLLRVSLRVTLHLFPSGCGSRYARWLHCWESPRVYWKSVEGVTVAIFMLNWRQNSLILKLIMCITLSHKFWECSMQEIDFKFWQRIGYWCFS
jgi:hypothetical protein